MFKCFIYFDCNVIIFFDEWVLKIMLFYFIEYFGNFVSIIY